MNSLLAHDEASHTTTLMGRLKGLQKKQTPAGRITALLQNFRQVLPQKPTMARHPSVSPEVVGELLLKFQQARKLTEKSRVVNAPELNLWSSLGFGRDEVANCRIISWFLERNGDHCQGNRFLKCLLTTLGLRDHLHLTDERFHVTREEWVDESNRVDIIIKGESFVLVIEAKIGATLSEDQCSKYYKIMKSRYPEKLFVGLFLTTKGSRSDCEHFRPITWAEVGKALRLFSHGESELSSQNALVSALARQYSDYIRHNITRRENGRDSALSAEGL